MRSQSSVGLEIPKTLLYRVKPEGLSWFLGWWNFRHRDAPEISPSKIDPSGSSHTDTGGLRKSMVPWCVKTPPGTQVVFHKSPFWSGKRMAVCFFQILMHVFFFCMFFFSESSNIWQLAFDGFFRNSVPNRKKQIRSCIGTLYIFLGMLPPRMRSGIPPGLTFLGHGMASLGGDSHPNMKLLMVQKIRRENTPVIYES